jgi:hypothetical protein
MALTSQKTPFFIKTWKFTCTHSKWSRSVLDENKYIVKNAITWGHECILHNNGIPLTAVTQNRAYQGKSLIYELRVPSRYSSKAKRSWT